MKVSESLRQRGGLRRTLRTDLEPGLVTLRRGRWTGEGIGSFIRDIHRSFGLRTCAVVWCVSGSAERRRQRCHRTLEGNKAHGRNEMSVESATALWATGLVDGRRPWSGGAVWSWRCTRPWNRECQPVIVHRC